MKKIICCVLCLFLLIPCALAEELAKPLTEEDAAYSWLYEKSVELAGRFQEAVSSDGYLGLLLSPSMVEEPLAALRQQDFADPEKVYLLPAAVLLPAQEAARALGGALEQADLSPGMKASLVQRVHLQLAPALAAQGGNLVLALSSALAVSDAWVQPDDVDSPYFAIVRSGGPFAFFIAFVPNENGVVIAQGQFIPAPATDDLPLE